MIPLDGTNTFTALYSIFMLSVLDPIKSLTAAVLSAADLPLRIMLILMVMVIGIGVIVGNANPAGVINRLIRMAIVVMFIAESGIYFHYVQGFFLNGIPTFINQHIISLATGGYGGNPSSPGTGFDHALDFILKDSKMVGKTAPTGLNGIVPRLELALCESVAVGALAFLFAVFIIVQTLLGVVIVIGPIMVLGYLFDYTKRITDGWVFALITLSIMTLVVDIVVLVLVAGVNVIFSNIVLSGNFEQNIQAMLAGASGVFVIALAVAALPRTIEGIGGGVALGLGLESSNRWLRGSQLFNQGPRYGGMAGRVGGRVASAGRAAGSRVINRIRNRNRGDS